MGCWGDVWGDGNMQGVIYVEAFIIIKVTLIKNNDLADCS